jgi:hypothetical protein
VRKRLITLGVATVLLLASPASAPAQEEQYAAPQLEPGPAEQPLGPSASGGGSEATPAAGPQAGPTISQQAAAQPQVDAAQTDTQTETDQAQTETDQTQTETTQQSPEEVPGQYCDPLADEGCEEGGGGSNRQSGDEQAQTESGSVAPVTAVGGELASTGAPLGLLALVGSALVGAGAALRRLARDSGAG